MKTLNYNENVRYGQNVEVSISTYDGAGRLNVAASCRNAERSTSVNLEYSLPGGARMTEITDYSAPFDAAFFSALDAKMAKVASAISNSNDGEEQA